MAQSQRMSQLVQRHTIDVDVDAHLPILVFVEMQISRQRLAIRRGRVKRMRQHPPRPIKRIAISMRSPAPHNSNRPRSVRVVPLNKIHLNHPRPLLQRPHHLGPLRCRRKLRAQRPEGVLQRSTPLARTVPTLPHRLHQRPNRTCLRRRPRTTNQRSPRHQLVTGRKHIRHLIPTRQLLHLQSRAPHKHLVPHQVRMVPQLQPVLQHQRPPLLPRNVPVKLHHKAPLPRPAPPNLPTQLLTRPQWRHRNHIQPCQPRLPLHRQNKTIHRHVAHDTLPSPLQPPQQLRRRRLRQLH